MRAALRAGRAPCGCDLALRGDAAAARGDDEAAAQCAHDATAAWARWGCPDGGGTPPDSFDAGCAAARARLAKLLRCEPDDLGATCPLYLTRVAWAETAFRARQREENGTLVAWMGRVPAPLWEAIDELNAATAQKDAADAERRKRVADRRRKGLPVDPDDED